MKIAFWVFCARKHTTKFKILTFGEINTIRFSNFNWIWIRLLFVFGKSGEYEYKYIRFWKITPIRTRILLVWKYLHNTNTNITIRAQLFEYYSYTEIFAHLWPDTSLLEAWCNNVTNGVTFAQWAGARGFSWTRIYSGFIFGRSGFFRHSGFRHLGFIFGRSGFSDVRGWDWQRSISDVRGSTPNVRFQKPRMSETPMSEKVDPERPNPERPNPEVKTPNV